MNVGWTTESFVFAVTPDGIMPAWQACHNITHTNPELKNSNIAVLERDAVSQALKQRPN